MKVATHIDQRLPDLAELLADPTAVPLEQIPAVLGELEQAKAALWARLTTPRSAAENGDRLLTLQEAAGLLGKSPAWLRRKAAGGVFPCARQIGRSWRFPATELERYVARMRRVG
jgi:excisionase family DNA binding protein